MLGKRLDPQLTVRSRSPQKWEDPPMELALPIALASMTIAGGAMLAAGAIWCFVFPRVQNEIGLAFGKWKASGLPTGAVLIVAGVALLYLGSKEESPSKPEISEVTLTTTEGQPSVEANLRCPFTVNLIGHISVSGGQGDIAYRFVRQPFNSPEEPSEIRNLRVDEPGSYSARDSYTFNVPVGQLYAEDRLEILRPENLTSDPVKMNVICNANLPPGPTTPPPDVPGSP
jgi:hypothetical protein